MPTRARPRVVRDSPPASAVSKNPFLALLPQVKRDVDRRLGRFLDAEIESARRHGREVAALVSAIREIGLRGGKRLRPALVVSGFRAANAKARLEPALEAGLALELLHVYLLIHDDWMDGDKVRRGGPSAHVLLGKRFRSERLGDAAAILAGDYAVGLATAALSRLVTSAERSRRIFSCFAEMQLAAVAGQQLDLLATSSDVEATYALKTGSYTVDGPLRIGALLAGARAPTLAALSAYARPVGIAFQLRDDLLGAFGDPKLTGKPLGSDLTAGKRTALVVQALRRTRGSDRRLLESVLGKPQAPQPKIERALQVIERSGAKKAVEQRISELADIAVAKLDDLVTEDGRRLLDGAARALTARQN